MEWKRDDGDGEGTLYGERWIETEREEVAVDLVGHQVYGKGELGDGKGRRGGAKRFVTRGRRTRRAWVFWIVGDMYEGNNVEAGALLGGRIESRMKDEEVMIMMMDIMSACSLAEA